MSKYFDYSGTDIKVKIENLYRLDVYIPFNSKYRCEALIFYIDREYRPYFKSEKDMLLFKLKYGI